MNSYRWADLREGQVERFDVELDREQLDAFRQLSGDSNDLHADPDFARRSGYRDVVVFGMLTAAFYSRLVGVHLPGRFALLQGINIDFIAPVFVGDHLQVSGEIVHLSEAVHRIELEGRIVNQDHRLVSKAKIRVGLHER